jgi:ribose transport system ATP-binding protein
MERTGARPVDPKKHFGTFSGGNQQKLVMGKWLHRSPRVLILHEPTQGVDVGARRDLLLLVGDAVASGTAVLVCSNDFEQLAEICQRVLVLSEGRTVAELSGPEVTAPAVAAAAQLLAT